MSFVPQFDIMITSIIGHNEDIRWNYLLIMAHHFMMYSKLFDFILSQNVQPLTV